jgi:hypothetical protein
VRRGVVLSNNERSGPRLSNVHRGNWRDVRSYAITQDYVLAEKA